MGFFKNLFKNTNDDIKKDKKIEFKVEVLKTNNLASSLLKVSEKYNISLSKLDFDILKIETYIKIDKDTDFVLMDINDNIEHLIDDKHLLSKEDFEIKQLYEIRVKKFKFSKQFELLGKFKTNKLLTMATFVVSPESKLVYSDKLKENILNELYKKKLKHQMLIHFKPLEKNLLEDVDKLVKYIKVMKKLEKEVSISLCSAIPPIKPVKLQIIEHYKKENKKKELISPIKKDEIIIEIIKPKEGKNGRTCKGKYIKVPELKKEDIPTFKINEADILVKEDDNHIKYIANKDGYIYIEDSAISIKDELEVKQISLKTGNVSGAHDSNVKLEVSENDVMKEAIADGMKVETTELNVKGNIGNNTQIKAKKLVIEGQTHRNSKIFANDAHVNVHRGLLKGKDVIINILEGGKVEAEKAYIKQAISGQVVAKEITVDVLGSHITLIASELIEIKTLRGDENKLIIDENRVENRVEKVKQYEETIENLKIKLKKIDKEYDKIRQIIIRNQSSVDELQKKIVQYKKNKMPINQTWLDKLKRFYEIVKKARTYESSLKEIKEEINDIKSKLEHMQDNIFLAKIISHSGFTEFNRIEFHLVEPSQTIKYDTKEDDITIKKFVLKEFGENDYKIVGNSDDSSN